MGMCVGEIHVDANGPRGPLAYHILRLVLNTLEGKSVLNFLEWVSQFTKWNFLDYSWTDFFLETCRG